MRPGSTVTQRRTARYDNPAAIRSGFESHYLAAPGEYLLPERVDPWGQPCFVAAEVAGCRLIAPDGTAHEIAERGGAIAIFWPFGWVVFGAAGSVEIDREARAAGLEQGARGADGSHTPVLDGATPSPATTAESDEPVATLTAEDLLEDLTDYDEAQPGEKTPKTKTRRKTKRKG